MMGLSLAVASPVPVIPEASTLLKGCSICTIRQTEARHTEADFSMPCFMRCIILVLYNASP